MGNSTYDIEGATPHASNHSQGGADPLVNSIANGMTGATTQQAAIDALLPPGNVGDVAQNVGGHVVMAAAPAGSNVFNSLTLTEQASNPDAVASSGILFTKEYVPIGAWGSGGNLGTARSYLAGCGTQTAGLCMGGGGDSNVTEEYDGAAWSSGGNLIAGRTRSAGAGTQIAGLCTGGMVSETTNLNSTEEYNGTSWSGGGNLTTARCRLAGAGTQSTGLCMGGYISAVSNVTEEYTKATPTTKLYLRGKDGTVYPVTLGKPE